VIVDEETILRSQLCPPLWEIEPLESQEKGMLYGNDRFDVRFTILDHKLPSIAYLFREKDRSNIDLGQSAYKPGSWIKALKSAFESDNREAEIRVGE
jgi:ribonuclease Z